MDNYMRTIGIWSSVATMLIAALSPLTVYGAGQDGVTTPPAAEKLGIGGGYFTCVTPEGWQRVDNDPDHGDKKIYMIEFNGPRIEGAPIMILVSYYGAGNRDFNDYKDFVVRNTTNVMDEVLAVAEKTAVNGYDALTFEREEKTFLHPKSKDDTAVMIKEKFYVILGRDRKGFFVLNYYAPTSVYADNLPVFEKVAGSFKVS